MPKLIDLATVLRSKNAGPLYVTFDLMFDKKETYERVRILMKRYVSLDRWGRNR